MDVALDTIIVRIVVYRRESEKRSTVDARVSSFSGNDPDTNNPRAPAWAWGYSKQDGKSFLLEMIVMSEDFSDHELSHR